MAWHLCMSPLHVTSACHLCMSCESALTDYNYFPSGLSLSTLGCPGLSPASCNCELGQSKKCWLALCMSLGVCPDCMCRLLAGALSQTVAVIAEHTGLHKAHQGVLQSLLSTFSAESASSTCCSHCTANIEAALRQALAQAETLAAGHTKLYARQRTKHMLQ